MPKDLGRKGLRMLIKTILIMCLAVAAATAGDIYMSMGMKSIGEIKINSVKAFFEVFVKVITSWKIWCAIAGMLTFFVLWLSVLSWADLSLALPLSALTYVLNAFLAKPVLGEHVSPARWVGTLIIFVGVVIVAVS